MDGIKCLSDALLIKSYEKAINENVKTDLIMLIVREMKERGIEKIDIAPDFLGCTNN